MASSKKSKDGPTVIKKYANRRLYDTGRSSYVTLDDLCEMVQEEHDFVVVDAKSGKDITRSVLTQIIVDQESGDETLLPTSFLRTLIGFYGNNMQAMLPGYLEQTMNVFAQNQEMVKEHINNSIGGMFPQPANFEDMARKNMEIFERTMKMMPPFNMAYMAGDEEQKDD